jgi:hypothetical protein
MACSEMGEGEGVSAVVRADRYGLPALVALMVVALPFTSLRLKTEIICKGLGKRCCANLNPNP